MVDQNVTAVLIAWIDAHTLFKSAVQRLDLRRFIITKAQWLKSHFLRGSVRHPDENQDLLGTYCRH